jgi:hypothetical protein
MSHDLTDLIARRDALRALTYKTDAITAELERLHRLIEQELWKAERIALKEKQ